MKKSIEIKEEEDEKTIYVSNKTDNYAFDDVIHKKIELEGDIVARLLSNNRGVFVDMRKYYKGYPTKKGIRISAFYFKKLYELLKDEIEKKTLDIRK